MCRNEFIIARGWSIFSLEAYEKDNLQLTCSSPRGDLVHFQLLETISQWTHNRLDVVFVLDMLQVASGMKLSAIYRVAAAKCQISLVVIESKSLQA